MVKKSIFFWDIAETFKSRFGTAKRRFAKYSLWVFANKQFHLQKNYTSWDVIDEGMIQEAIIDGGVPMVTFDFRDGKT